jgi:hypothetical protein
MSWPLIFLFHLSIIFHIEQLERNHKDLGGSYTPFAVHLVPSTAAGLTAELAGEG